MDRLAWCDMHLLGADSLHLLREVEPPVKFSGVAWNSKRQTEHATWHDTKTLHASTCAQHFKHSITGLHLTFVAHANLEQQQLLRWWDWSRARRPLRQTPRAMHLGLAALGQSPQLPLRPPPAHLSSPARAVRSIIRKTYTCSRCGCKSCDEEKVDCLSLEMPDDEKPKRKGKGEGKYTLQELLHSYFQVGLGVGDCWRFCLSLLFCANAWLPWDGKVVNLKCCMPCAGLNKLLRSCRVHMRIAA